MTDSRVIFLDPEQEIRAAAPPAPPDAPRPSLPAEMEACFCALVGIATTLECLSENAPAVTPAYLEALAKQVRIVSDALYGECHRTFTPPRHMAP